MKLYLNRIVIYVPLICRSMKPGAMMAFWQSCLMSASAFSSKNTGSGFTMRPFRIQRSSFIRRWWRSSRQLVNWINWSLQESPLQSINSASDIVLQPFSYRIVLIDVRQSIDENSLAFENALSQLLNCDVCPSLYYEMTEHTFPRVVGKPPFEG